MEIVHGAFSFQSFIYCTNKSPVGLSVYRQAWNKYNFCTKSNIFSKNIDDLSATRSLLTFEYMMSLVPICKTAISDITSVSFKVDQYNDGNVLMLHHQRSNNCSWHCKVDFSSQVFNVYPYGDGVTKKDCCYYFIMYHFLNRHIVPTLPEGCFFHFWCLIICIWGTQLHLPIYNWFI